MRSVLVAGATVTLATGTMMTVTALVPLLPSLVAVIVAAPAATAVTRPLAETVATPVGLLDQVTMRPLSTLPAESLVVALSCAVPPTTRPAVAGTTVTVATGTAVTVIDDVANLPSLVAVIVADPAATAVTRPLAETVATAGALLDQVTTRPLNTLPAESLVVALSCAVAPTRTLADAGDTVTVATGITVTVIDDVPDFPSLVAVMVAEPVLTALTIPFTETVATAGLPLDQVTARPVSVLPAESFVVALSCALPPMRSVPEAGATTTLATGTTATVIAALPLWP